MAWPVLLLGGFFAGFSRVLSRFLVPYIVVNLLLSLGITVFSIVGTIWLSNYIEAKAIAYFNSIGGAVGSILIMAGVLDAITILFNCWIAAILIKRFKGAFKGFKLL